ncbi:MAG: flagellar filament capping protein FliD [Pseudomonadota bacterium]
MITATGVGSGLDVSGLVKQLVEAERAGSDLQLTRESSKLNAKLSALGTLKGVVGSFQSSLAGLNNLSSYGKRTATSSDDKIFSVVADGKAIPNSYAIEVSKLASSQALASVAVADSTTTKIGTGTLTFRFGNMDYDADTETVDGFTLNPDSKVTTLVVDESNNTLEGLMTSINKANFGVKASIVNDGEGFRLLLASDKTGVQNSLEISVDDADGIDTDAGAAAGLSNFAFNSQGANFSQTRAAANSAFTINGLSVSNASNHITTAIPGVTIDLKGVSTGPVQLDVKSDTTSIANAMGAFVAGYNQFTKTVKSLTSYNAATNTAGVLLGDASARAIVGQVDGVLRNAVSGIVGEFGSLSEIGMKTTATGEYTLDTDKFKKLLDSDPDSIKALFTALGVPTDPDIKYIGSSSATRTGNYSLDVSQLADAGYFGGSSALPDFSLGNTLTLNSGNNTIRLEVDGISTGDLVLTEGAYTSGESLASELQARINGSSALVKASTSVNVTYSAETDSLTIKSATIGSGSSVKVVFSAGNMAADLGLPTGAGVAGHDVAGTINGVAGKGIGEVLTAQSGNNAEGLVVAINGGTTGSRGTVKFSRGIADQLNTLLSAITARDGSLNDRIENLGEKIAAVKDKKSDMEVKWTAITERYTAQFNALDTMLAGLKSTSTYLETQLANLPGVVRNNN